MPTIYHFDFDTGELIGAEDAALDPKDETPLVPRGATLTAPPIAGADQVAVYQGTAWSLQPDHRGEIYWLPDGQMVEVLQIGDVPPPEALSAAPPPSIEDQRAVAVLSRYEFAIAAKDAGFVTAAEALDWIRQVSLPAAVEAAINSLPAGQQDDARIQAYGDDRISRVSPLMSLIAAAYSATDAQLDAMYGIS